MKSPRAQFPSRGNCKQQFPLVHQTGNKLSETTYGNCRVHKLLDLLWSSSTSMNTRWTAWSLWEVIARVQIQVLSQRIEITEAPSHNSYLSKIFCLFGLTWMQSVRAEKASFWQSNLLQPESPTERELMKSFTQVTEKLPLAQRSHQLLSDGNIRNPQHAMEDVICTH